MPIHRRNFLQTIAAASLIPAVRLSGKSASEDQVSMSFPKGLAAGSHVGIASPASGATTSDIQGFINLCNSMGYKPVKGDLISNRDGYLSGSDQQRADEFMRMIEDPTIDAIICSRGGYGVMRILPMLDYGSIRDANKIIMGYSDITSLLIAANQLSGIITYHGPVASSTFNQFTVESFNTVVTAPPGDSRGKDGNSEYELPQFHDSSVTTIVSGVGRGRLTGGNLAMVEATLGTKYEIDTMDAILFLEEINEEPYRIDRMLTHLWLSGKLQTCKGIAIGNFKNCEAKGVSITGPTFTLREVIEERTKDLGIPVVYGLPFGHVKSKLTLPLGVQAELNASTKSIRLLQPAVSA